MLDQHAWIVGSSFALPLFYPCDKEQCHSAHHCEEIGTLQNTMLGKTSQAPNFLYGKVKFLSGSHSSELWSHAAVNHVEAAV